MNRIFKHTLFTSHFKYLIFTFMIIALTGCGSESSSKSPVITLNGDEILNLNLKNEYDEQGATAVDADGSPLEVTITGNVDTLTEGIYSIQYSATSASGEVTSINRVINVIARPLIMNCWTGDADYKAAKINTEGDGYKYNVDWGDGETDSDLTNSITHIYKSTDTYTITISGNLPRLQFASICSGDRLTIEQWGDIKWQSMKESFTGFTGTLNLVNASDTPDLSEVTDMSYMFTDSLGSIPDLKLHSWDVSTITNMEGMFHNLRYFNQDITNWDVSSVTNMSNMFNGAEHFNQDISNWDVSSVTNMSAMFNDANDFNQDINNWSVSSVTDMSKMFKVARSFNQPLSSWNVSSVINTSEMFYRAEKFNQTLNDWNVSSVTNMKQMFLQSLKFNQELYSWDVSSVTNMHEMFMDAEEFNQNINAWDVSSVTDMSNMFQAAESYKQPLNDWDVSSVTSMAFMFDGIRYNQNLGSWDISSVTDMERMFSWYSLSQDNYDALLQGWSTRVLKPNVTFNAGNTKYSVDSQTARDILVNTYNWDITDGGLEP